MLKDLVKIYGIKNKIKQLKKPGYQLGHLVANYILFSDKDTILGMIRSAADNDQIK